MADPTAVAAEVDDTRLAQLACLKLAGMVQGAISVGLPGVVSGTPDPRAFFDAHLEVLTGYARVLHTSGGTSDRHEETLRLRERSKAVLTALASFRRALFNYLDAPADAAPSLEPARNAGAALCDALRDYGEMIAVDGARLLRVKEVVLQVFDGVEDMIAGRATTVG